MVRWEKKGGRELGEALTYSEGDRIHLEFGSRRPVQGLHHGWFDQGRRHHGLASREGAGAERDAGGGTPRQGRGHQGAMQRSLAAVTLRDEQT